MNLYLYAIQHHDDVVWCSPPFVAYDENEARAAVLQALYDLSLEEEVDLNGNTDCVVCLGEFDPYKMIIKGYPTENQKIVFYISDLMEDVSEFEKDGDEYE